MAGLALFAGLNIVVLAECWFSGKSPEFCLRFYDWSGPAVVIEGGEVEHRTVFLGGGGSIFSQFGEGGGDYFRFDQPIFFVFLSKEDFITTAHLCLLAVEFDIFDELSEINSCFSPLLVGHFQSFHLINQIIYYLFSTKNQGEVTPFSVLTPALQVLNDSF